jgi:acetoacetyl-CoA reductase/3-oxoacyl-[acyl-carrier protein] reductase
VAGEVADGIVAAGGRALPVQLAVEDRGSVVAALITLRARLGPVTILVNNAAVAHEVPFATITDADWDRVLGVNLRGAFTCVQETLPDMLAAGWGRIVNVTSIGGQIGGVNQVHYAAAKAGLVSLTRSLARLYGPQGITSNAVAPGLVPTDMSAREMASEGGQAKIATLPLGRAGTVEEIAGVVAFLASDAASYVTGQTVNVNGGAYLG